MIANYGYKDGSGDYYIILDTDKCDGCGLCVTACPEHVLLMGEDIGDPLRDAPVVLVTEEHRKKLKYSCSPCKPTSGVRNLPCVIACPRGALTHSW